MFALLSLIEAISIFYLFIFDLQSQLQTEKVKTFLSFFCIFVNLKSIQRFDNLVYTVLFKDLILINDAKIIELTNDIQQVKSVSKVKLSDKRMKKSKNEFIIRY
ncbi:hypothetical protein RFI_25043 [Reticulomyxa filosa]|uniref:Uncharacterized protein n=1 Tax=Reticulomyxa filosa TaxID=46433 RepID=X6MEL2_RETFI|nr:hypothetical protein RFI_25043 [Reticulomyxa filosa]|eukprot:ETO12334.1 hypothetical protein RFI_25043 [Reticulomyxa filosa]